MEAIVVGIDVSKDRLDVHVHPAGECFAVGRNAEGLDALIARLAPLGAEAVAVAFDLETRKIITLSDEALAEADASVIEGLTL